MVKGHHQGYVHDDDGNWVYNEELAQQHFPDGDLLIDSNNVSGDENRDSSDEGEWGEGKRRVAPRRHPRSKAQRLVDDAEDSVEGARPVLLDLSGLGAIRVSSRVYNMHWLKQLNLARNNLCRVSPDIDEMVGLVSLDLSHNRLKTIPDEMEVLVQLKELNLSHNLIEGFQGNIYLISSLETLNLAHNSLKEIPVQVGDLQLLKRSQEWEV
ncbi:unnamed protein product, partial [Choristocarpus tenellus]